MWQERSGSVSSVVGANSVPTGIPNLRCGGGGNCIPCKWLSDEATGLRGTSTVFALFWKGCFGVSGHTSPWQRKVRSLSHRRADRKTEKSLPLVSDWSVLMQIRAPSPHSMIGPTGQNGTPLIGW